MNSTRKFSIKINGNDYAVEIAKIGDGVASVDVNGTVYEVEFQSEKKVSKTPTLVRTPAYTTEAERPKTTAKPAENTMKVVKSPLPGVILDVHKREGDAVKAGEVVMIMEAMKMENNIVSPIDGTLRSLKVQRNDNVLEGDVLFEIGG